MSDYEREALPTGWVATVLGELLTVMRGVSYDKADARDTPDQGLVPILRALPRFW
jgi:hypothetical protein